VAALSDFWWLSSEVDASRLNIGLCTHHPLTDSERPALSWRCAFDDREVNIRGSPCLHSLAALNEGRQLSNNINVYRTLELFDEHQRPQIVGPFIIDVDNETQGPPYEQDIAAALLLAKAVVNLLVRKEGLSSSDLRVYFSGCKGFNVEVRPDAIGVVGSLSHQARLSYQRLDDLILELVRAGDLQPESYERISTIDRIYTEWGALRHPYVRLHDSVNAWISSQGSPMARKKLEIAPAHLSRTVAAELCLESEQLAKADSS
jgi:hypothetical protein